MHKTIKTGLFDREGTEIENGDHVGLDGITADNSMGELPNGWNFSQEEDIFEVYFDERIKNWSLKLGCEPDTPYNIKYMNHAVGMLHCGDCIVVAKQIPSPF